MTKTLNTLTKGDIVTVVRVGGEGSIRRRMFDMGITPGANIVFKKAAPFGDPIEINVRGYELAIRKAEAQYIEVECVECLPEYNKRGKYTEGRI